MNSSAGPLVVLLGSFTGLLSAGNNFYTRPPVAFERGTDGQPLIVHLAGRTLVLGDGGAVYEYPAPASTLPPKPLLRFAGARAHLRPEADGPPVGIANYFLGSSPAQWRTNVPLFQRISYPELYPGIELVYYGSSDQLEYDLVVSPRASWRPIRLSFPSADAIEIDNRGDLKFPSRWGWLTHRRPNIYQISGTSRWPVAGHYVLKSKHEVGFEIGAYDPHLPLIIDPTLSFASYLGGDGDDYGHAVAVDSSGCAYVVGETGSAGFPTFNPQQAAIAGTTDVFITKWNASGTGLVYSTYIGGSNRDVALGVAVDTAGNAYVTGFTYSADFPITPGALRSSFVGDSKAFVLKLSPGGNALLYSTFLGGSGDDYANAIAVDSSGEAHIAGYTSSIDFPATAGAFQTSYGGGSYDGFLAKLNAGGSALVFATYLGGLQNDTAASVALDPSGNIYVTGQTQSGNFPTYNPFQPTNSESDAFVVKLSASGRVVYSTYLGGTGLTNGTGIAADAAGNAYVTGFTDAFDFPVTSGAYQTTNNGSYDAFLAVLNSYGSGILSATYLGGSGSDIGYAIALDESGNIYVVGSTNSIDFPVLQAIQSGYQGDGDAFAAAFNNQLTSRLYATYFGGAEADVAASVAVDSAGDAYFTGWTSSGASSSGIPVTPGAFQPMGQGGVDAFLAKLAPSGSGLSCESSVPQLLSIQAGSSSQLLGDYLLSCSGGTAGTSVTANLQIILNTPIANTSQAQIFVGSNSLPVWGTLNWNGSITFQNVSFSAPGPSASITLRITNVWSNAASLAVGGPVTMTVSVPSSSPAISVSPAQQTVAMAANLPTPQLQQIVLSQTPPLQGCQAPQAVSGFLVSNSQAVVWFEVANASAGAVARVDWISPSNITYQSHSYTSPGSGNQCLSDSMLISGSPQPMAGAWSVNVYWNNTSLASVPFVISATGVEQLVWQNTSTRQVTAHYYSSLPADIGWNWLNPAGVPGWTVVGIADMNADGVPDLIWQNNATRQVTVNYYGGPGGTTYQGWAYMNAAGVPGWTVVGVADMNGDGVPDLIWQNDTTKQITVNYYGGVGGAEYQGWAWLNSTGNPGWSVVGVADFDGNGTPDLVWQNLSTRQVTVNYYGGPGGAIYQGWAYLNAAGVPGWTVVGATDITGNGVPDLIWENDATAQVTVNYYGGAGGAVYLGWNWLASAGFPGWHVIVPWCR